MIDKSAAIIFIVLFLTLAAVGGLTTGISTISGWFAPKRIVIDGVTPASVNVHFLYRLQVDGPITIVATDKAGVQIVTNYAVPGIFESGDNDYTNISTERLL